MSDPRFQVFLSSTYLDLQEERRGVTEQLLQLRAIPAGMELFTASGQPPWWLIERGLEDSDYMVLILAGRYGSSTDEDPRSYTEREYDYAVSNGIPVLPFLHHNLDALPHGSVDVGLPAERRDAFWAKVRNRHTVNFWTDSDDLSRKVMAAVIAAFANEPRPGWVRHIPNGGQNLESSGTSDPAPVSHKATRTTPVRSTPPMDGTSLEREVDAAVRSVTGLPFLQRDSNFNALNGVDLQTEHASRVAQIEEAARPLVQMVAATARWDTTGQLDRYWLDLIQDMSAAPNANGLTALIHLVRAPAALVLNAAGVGACAGRRDNLVGLLLSPQLEVENPYDDREVPAISTLGATLLYAQGWPGRRLGLYLKSALVGDDWQGHTLERAWERWQYLTGVARTFYASTLKVSSGGQPHLTIDERPQVGVRPTVGRRIRKEVAAKGNAHPLLSGGLCDGISELFDTAAETFEVKYGAWGDEQDWAALPSHGTFRGGAMPTGPHYPGDRA